MNFFEHADEGTVVRHYDDDTYVIKNIKTTIDDDNIWRNTFNVVPNNF